MGLLGNAIGWISDKIGGVKNTVVEGASAIRQPVLETRQKITGLLKTVLWDTPLGIAQEVWGAGEKVVKGTRDAIGWTLNGALGLATSVVKAPFVAGGTALELVSRPLRIGRDLVKKSPDMVRHLWQGDPSGVREIVRETRVNALQPLFS